MSQPVWTCKCCSDIFAERLDFDAHKEECIKRGKVCPRCSELFTEVGLNFHLINSLCGLRKYNVIDLHTCASEVNDKRISVIVKDYHKKIVTAAMDGKFKTRLGFIYPDDNQVARADALSRMVSELKKLFTNVDITPDHLGTFIDVSWLGSAFHMALFKEGLQKNINHSKGDDDDFPNTLKTLPELGAAEIDISSPITGFKNISLLAKARMGKSAFLNVFMSDSLWQGDNHTKGDDDDLPDALKTLPEKNDDLLEFRKGFTKKCVSKETKTAIWEKFIGPTSTQDQE